MSDSEASLEEGPAVDGTSVERYTSSYFLQSCSDFPTSGKLPYVSEPCSQIFPPSPLALSWFNLLLLFIVHEFQSHQSGTQSKLVTRCSATSSCAWYSAALLLKSFTFGRKISVVIGGLQGLEMQFYQIAQYIVNAPIPWGHGLRRRYKVELNKSWLLAIPLQGRWTQGKASAHCLGQD